MFSTELVHCIPTVSAFKLAAFAYIDPVVYEGTLENKGFVENIVSFMQSDSDPTIGLRVSGRVGLFICCCYMYVLA